MKTAVGSVLAVAILLAGCGSKTDANEGNFSAAIKQYLDKKGDQCLSIAKWPVDVSGSDLSLQKTFPTNPAGQMAALEAVGLVKGEDAEVEITGLLGQPTGSKARIKRYTLTDAAKPFVQTKVVELIGLGGRTKEERPYLCWGKKALDKVVKWEGPSKFGDYQEARVTYLYKIEGLADWAKKPELQTAFPYIGQSIDGAGKKEQQHAVKLTNVGWEAKGLDG